MNATPGKIINVRAPSAKQALIDHAATLSAMNRTEFILDAACEKAHEVPADQTRFALDRRALQRFNMQLDAPLQTNAAIRRPLNTPVPREL